MPTIWESSRRSERFLVRSKSTPGIVPVRLASECGFPTPTTLYDSDEQPLAAALIDSLTGTRLQAQLVVGTYYLGITAPQNATGSNVEPNYELTLSPLDPVTNTEIDDREAEPNDLFDSANELGDILDDRVVTGQIAVRSGDGNSPIGQRSRFPNADFYRFSAVEQADFRIGISLDRFQHNPVLTLYDANRQTIGSPHPLPDLAGVTLFENLSAGTYFVSVTAPPNSTGSDVEPNYTLSIAAAASNATPTPIDGFEIESNDSLAEANQIGPVEHFTTVSGSLHLNRISGNNHLAAITAAPDPDYFAFSTAVAGAFDFQFTTNRLPYRITFTLFDAAGNRGAGRSL